MRSLSAGGAGNNITSLKLSLSFECGEHKPPVEDDDQLFVGVVSVQLEGSRPCGYFEER
jgi:hypothetical protein